MIDQRLDETAEIFFAAGQKGGFSVWKQWICHENFDLIPPFRQSYVCLGLNLDFFRKIEKEVRESGLYDWIVVEVDHAYNGGLTQWMADADKILLIVRQGEKWNTIIPVMKKSMAVIPREKFRFIYLILRNPCVFKENRHFNVRSLCIFPCFCPYEPKQGKLFV